MKKYFFTLSLLITCLNGINAQDINDNSIGLRFGGGNGSAGEISYQKALGSNNRLEIDLGLANDFTDFKATGLYQWVWNLEDRFNWYTGFGGGLVSANKIGLYGAGVIGLEYNFNEPILLSIDYRPEIGIAGGLNGINSNVALALKYQF